MRRSLFALSALAACLVAAPGASAQTKLLRFPDVSGDKVAFVYAGDIWVASSNGGSAVRITTHPGVELFPKFSPDGQWIAFTGQYEGDEQVYVVPAGGGVPKQLTFYPANGPLPQRWGFDNQVYGWTPDGKSVLFRSMSHGWDLTDTLLFTVPAAGGFPEALPMPVSGAGELSPDGKQVVYTPLTRDFRTWKRYQGGWAQDLWIFDLASHDATRVTENVRTDRDPMWIGKTIYFVSDRDGTLNLYSFDPTSKTTTQLTKSTTWDVRWASGDPAGQIVYEYGGELVVFDTKAGKEKKVSITVPTDGLPSRPARISVGDYLEDAQLSPKGERALFVARGEVFTAPIEKGPTRNLTRTSGAHEKHARWSPDGTKIAYMSDATGEDELYVVAQDGSGQAERITTDGKVFRYQPEWSPKGDKIAFGDKNGKLFIVDLATKKMVEVADSPADQILDYSWSPHGSFLAFSMPEKNALGSIHIYDVAAAKLHKLGDTLWNEYTPSWDPAGNYLYFLSDRSFAPQFSAFEWNYAGARQTGIYAVGLRKDVAHPFPGESDEVTIEKKADEKEKDAKDAKGDKDGEKKEEEKKDEALKIDFEGLANRVTQIPVPFDNYFGLAGLPDGHLLYVSGPSFYYGREPNGSVKLHIFSFKDRKSTELSGDMNGVVVSADGKKLLVSAGGGFQLMDASPGGAGSAKPVSTRELEMDRVPREEWAQIFHEVWRRFRDFFYVENMHGYDWAKIRDQYAALLPHVGHRSDLNYLIGEMIAELNVGHAYNSGGDWVAPERPDVALPGAWFELDKAAGRFKITRILPGDNEEPKYRSPLTEPGVKASVGDYVLAINGQELKGNDSPYRLLRGASAYPVELTLNTKPTFEGSWKTSYRAVSSEDSLLYLDFVEKNRRYVAEKTGGKVGYIHVPDMGQDGIYEFIKYYYGQLDKQGLVIDVRNNGGGNVSQWLLNRLNRKLLSQGYSRNNELPGPYPSATFHGSLVCLLNENSASDGDIFPAMFKASGLGPLIGKRSWGGVIGITSRGPLVDGGGVNVPEFGFLDAKGQWAIEGWGVDPDIEVDNDPKSMIQGKDNQLDRGIEEVLKAIKNNPKSYPPEPPPPVKTAREIQPPPGR
ncbi:MAG: S41 family peptidase [Thermoanaerobaculia bacterium]|nr:S41 family peptidase [Thermoanaerobaculia bacterium]